MEGKGAIQEQPSNTSKDVKSLNIIGGGKKGEEIPVNKSLK